MFDKLLYLFKPLILIWNVGLTIRLKAHKIYKKFFTNVKDYYLSLVYLASLRSLDCKHTLSSFPFEACGSGLHYDSNLLTNDTELRKAVFTGSPHAKLPHWVSGQQVGKRDLF